MNNNFDEINRNDESDENADVNESNTEPKAEDIPSVTYDYSDDTASDGTYSMKREDIVKDDFAPKAPDYSTTRANGEGSIDYAPMSNGKKTKKSKKGAAGKVLFAVACVLLSLVCGFAGATLSNYFFAPQAVDNADADTDADKNDGTVIIDRVVEHVETSSEGSELTYTDVEILVGDSVVAITTEHKVTSFWQEYVTSGAGSGVIISEDGYVITNHHVISSTETSFYGTTMSYADKITVSLKNGETYEATIIGGSADADIAVIKIEPREDERFVSAKFADSDKLKVGEEVIAIGNPLGELSGTTTNGIISALARKVTIENVEMNLLQTNAAINPGNSGGGLFNMSGELVGVVNAKSSGTGIEGLGFAIPSNDAYAVATEIIETGGNVTNTASVKIGITTVNIFTAADAQKYKVNAYGVYIYDVEKGYNDGVLKAGDRIIAVNDTEIASGDDVVSIVRSSKAGDKLNFIVYRDGKLKNVEVTVFENKAAEDVDF